jgi:hypothetical protein
MTDTIDTGTAQAAGAAAEGTAVLESAAVQAVTGFDLDGLLGDVVRKAVSAQYAAAAKEIAAEAVGQILTDDLRARMAAAAVAEAQAALDPPIEVPEAGEDAEQEGEAGEEPTLRRYATVQAFVEEWVSEVYRRETTERNIENHRRWCPEWWRHGEAKARFEALWDAFEALRQGETVEMSVFWLVHADPHMTRLFDPEGVFKYCSPAVGHHGQLAALPVVPAPANYGSSDVDTEVTEPEHPAGLVIPSVPTRRRVVIRTDFP